MKNKISKKNKVIIFFIFIIKYIMEIKCKICGEEDEFKFYNSNKSTCKKCASERVKKRYNNLTEKEKKEYKIRSKKWQIDNFFKYKLLQAKSRANEKNIIFDIDEEYLIKLWENQKGKCLYSNIDMKMDGSGNFTGSLDRKDSNLGYTKENVYFVLTIVNSMKNNLNEREFLELIKKIYITQF